MKKKGSAAFWGGMIFALFYPLVLTWGYFIIAKSDPDAQRGFYAVGKGIQFLFPVCFAALVLKEPWRLRFPNRRGLLLGGIFGWIVFVAAVALWEILAKSPLIAESAAGVKANLGERLRGAGLDSWSGYLILALFYSVIHSGLEEYYWRWFAFGRLATRLFWPAAAVVSSLGFTLHHILILGDYFGFTSILTLLAVTGVFIGGLFWSWLYRRSDSIWGPWLGHGIIDAAIFVIGGKILFS